MLEKKVIKEPKKNLPSSRGFLYFCFFTSVFLLFSSNCNAQEPLKKPKIGLVLSGGGAKGLAHIGVLKVIDSLGIKIDYIGGTSMGAIVGGLYASGYTAKQLDSIFTTIDIDALIQDYIPRSSKSFFEKRNDETYVFTLPFKNFKIITPNALSKGTYNYNLLSQLTYHVRNNNDFSQLPIPFFCMATNIENGEEVILDKGVLAQALVASGAIPSLFNPIEIDTKLLVDGGVKNNYPVENLKAMGADYIIGVDVQDELKTRKDLNGVTTILLQISNFSTLDKMQNKIKLTDIYIKPNINGYSVLSFDDGKKIINLGETEAKKETQKLLLLQNKNYKKPNLVTENKVLDIKEINFNETKNYTRAYLLGKLKFKSNSIIDYSEFQKGIQNLTATQNFSSIKYNFNGNNLNFDLKENPVNTYLKFGLHYDDFFKSGALINITQKKIISKNDVFSLDLILGDNFRYDLNYLIDNGFYWSVGFNSNFITFNKNISSDFGISQLFNSPDLRTINLDYSSLSNQFFIQTIFSKKFTISVGTEWQHLKMKTQNFSINNGIIENSDYLSIYGNITHDSFNKKYFPTKGWYIKTQFKSFLYSSDYTNQFDRFSIGKFDLGLAFAPIKKLAFLFQADGGSKIGTNSIPYFDFVFGGYGFREVNNIKPFYGYNYLSILGNSYVKVTATADFEFYKKNHVNISYNAANIGNFIFNATQDWINRPTYSGFAFGYGFESFIGPIEIKYSWSPETGNTNLWFNLGFVF